jgi:hypothetical protein
MLFRDSGSVVLHDVSKLRKNSSVCLLKYMKMKQKKICLTYITLYENGVGIYEWGRYL